MKQSILRIELNKKDPHADPKCVFCKGYGYYDTIHCEEVDEMIVQVRCSCTNAVKAGRE